MFARLRIKNHELRIKNLILNILFMTLASLFMIHPVYAQTSISTSSANPYTSPRGEAGLYPIPSQISPTSPLYTDMLIYNMFHTFSCLGIGQSIIGQPCLTYQVTKNAQGAIQSIPVLSQVDISGGALGTATSLIGALYDNPPVRTADYLASVGQDLGIVKEARAQVVGSGEAVLRPILALWKVSRNISYLIMIIIFIVIGLMIIFRNKINPQTVITAQAALPGLVIGLILITFSYFLAGLIADTAFIGTNLVAHYFSAAQPSASPKLAQDIASDNVGNIFSKFVGMISSGDISSVINSVLGSLDGGVQFWVRLLAGIIGFQTGASIGGPIGSIVGTFFCGAITTALATSTGGLGAALAPACANLSTQIGQGVFGAILGGITATFPGETFGLVLYFVAMAALIYTMFKLFLRLINSYLTIIFLTISAPFQFLFSSLPGRQGIMTDWILNLLANVLAFPAVFAVFYFVAYLWGPNTAPGQFFGITNQLDLTNNQTLPLFGRINLSFIRILLAFGALLATPTIPDIIIRTISKVSQAGQLIGQEISGGARSGQGYAGRVGAVPGQIGRGLVPLQQTGASYETVIDPLTGNPVTLYKPSLIGRIRGQRARII